MKQCIFILFLILLLAASSRAEIEQSLQLFLNNPTDVRLAEHQIKSGTRYVLLVYQNWAQLNFKEQQTYLSRAQEPPLRQRTILSPSGRFTLHWDESGLHAVPPEDISSNGIPDYIDSAAVIFDRVWQMEIDSLGFQAPPGDDGNPVERYPIYFSEMPYYGLTWYSGVDIPSLPGENYTSYMEVENDFTGFPSDSLDGLKVTAAHEFNHAIQFGYNVRVEDFFFYEMTSTWMEDVVYPEINDYYQYLDSFFGSVSNTRFNYYNAFTLYPYGNCLYLKMLALQFNPFIVTEIWDRIKTESSIQALTHILSSPTYNTSWVLSLNQYALWLYFSGSRAIPGNYFREGVDFPEVSIKSSDKFFFDLDFNRSFSLSDFANRYILFSGLNNQSVTFNVGVPGAPQAGFLAIRDQQNSDFIPVNSIYTSEADVADTLILILTNAEEMDTVFSVLASTESFDQIVYGPNPVNLAEGQHWIEFRNLPTQSELLIFTVAGKRVIQLENENRANLQWNLKNEKGESIAAGIYLFMLRGNHLLRTGKIAVIR